MEEAAGIDADEIAATAAAASDGEAEEGDAAAEGAMGGGGCTNQTMELDRDVGCAVAMRADVEVVTDDAKCGVAAAAPASHCTAIRQTRI